MNYVYADVLFIMDNVSKLYLFAWAAYRLINIFFFTVFLRYFSTDFRFCIAHDFYFILC